MGEVTDRDIGNAWTAHILGQLFSGWPRRQDLNAMDVAVATGFQPRSEPKEMFDDLVMWLNDNGYLKIN
ncbi:hypothetical protein [Rhizobium terrae]|uniref:hypothetical protein n=1 Tax=Rhizobium terrae TaxID=2171756 RepID=UPI000E3E9054|nr:hypothetical protein [Rhizobium terrae]